MPFKVFNIQKLFVMGSFDERLNTLLRSETCNIMKHSGLILKAQSSKQLT